MPRKQAPAAVRLLRGRSSGRDSGGRKIAAPPRPSFTPPARPPGLSTAVRREWRRTVAELVDLGLPFPPGVVLAGYCRTLVRQHEVGAALDLATPGTPEYRRLITTENELAKVIAAFHAEYLTVPAPAAPPVNAGGLYNPFAVAPDSAGRRRKTPSLIIDNWLFSPVRDAIKAGAISGMSFRFEVLDESWTYSDGRPIPTDRALIAELERTWDGSISDSELPIRTLKELRVPEVGPVTFPAYLQTSISVRQGTIDLDRLQEPEQRKLLARAIFTLDDDARRGAVGIDDGLRAVRSMLLDAATRRVRVANQPKVGIDEGAAAVRGMMQDIQARKERASRYPA